MKRLLGIVPLICCVGCFVAGGLIVGLMAVDKVNVDAGGNPEPISYAMPGDPVNFADLMNEFAKRIDAEAVVVSPDPPRAAELVDIEGVYLASGKLPGGKEYGSDPQIVTITQQGQGYAVQWNLPGALPSFGTAMRKGPELTVGFTPYGSNAPCIARYSIEAAGPKLVGKWMTPGGQVGEETLSFVRKLPEK